MTTSRKMIVSVARRMLRAISFGVFWRAAPSTSAIIRSMNVSPGFVVIFTTIRSDSTVVPPVTAHRSPPDSRMTGADSPVMADSSTVARPSTTSPSPGITWPASTTTRSPIRRCAPATCSSRVPVGSLPTSRRAIVSVRAARRVAAWALPRPSATASARLAKTTVTQSQTATPTAKTDGFTTARTVVSSEPTQTTKITGDRTTCRGSSLVKACGSAAVKARGFMTAPPRGVRERGWGSRSGR